MTATTNDHEHDLIFEKMAQAYEEFPVEDALIAPEHTPMARNPRLGPMVVLDDTGYLVPLFTAGDLLRGFQYLWRISQEKA